jgi:hypothetical protein
MRPTLRTAKRFEDLLGSEDPAEPYDYGTIFDSSTWRARRRSKKKFRLLRRIDDAVREMLTEGETVHFVTMGSAVSFWESYFLGWMVYYLNRRAIVLTDRRIILLQIDSKMRPKELRSQLRYTAITRVERSFVSGTNVHLRNGRKRAFSGVPKADRKFLAELVARLKRLVGEGFAAQAVEDLCPHCFALAGKAFGSCGECGGPFKSARRAGLLSLLFPGFGDLYIGHKKLAVLEILVVSLIWLSMLWPNPDYTYSALGYLLLGGIVVLFVHLPDAVGTWYIARMGIYPAKKHVGLRVPVRAVAR